MDPMANLFNLLMRGAMIRSNQNGGSILGGSKPHFKIISPHQSAGMVVLIKGYRGKHPANSFIRKGEPLILILRESKA